MFVLLLKKLVFPLQAIGVPIRVVHTQQSLVDFTPKYHYIRVHTTLCAVITPTPQLVA